MLLKVWVQGGGRLAGWPQAFHEEQITLPAVTASRASANIEVITQEKV